MSTAHANLDDLRRLQRSVARSQDQIDQAMTESLQKDLNGADWKDPARQDFEGKLKEAISAVRQTNNRLGEFSPILAKKIGELSVYLGR